MRRAPVQHRQKMASTYRSALQNDLVRDLTRGADDELLLGHDEPSAAGRFYVVRNSRNRGADVLDDSARVLRKHSLQALVDRIRFLFCLAFGLSNYHPAA